LDRPTADDKLKALLAYRKKHGFYYKGGETWGHNHKCPQQVSLHVIEELFDALQQSNEPNEIDSEEEIEIDVLVVVGDSNDQQAIKRKTMKLCGKVGNLDVLILVDSSSVGTFFSDKLAEQLHCATQICPAVQFMAVDGSPIVCPSVFPQL